MDKIIELGISDNELKVMLEQSPSIINMSNEEVNQLIEILRNVGCNDNQIRNIIVCNPYYLSNFSEDVINLINYLSGLGFSNLELLFDMNPFLLNKYDLEIREYFRKRMFDGLVLEDIVDEIESNPYIVDEY